MKLNSNRPPMLCGPPDITAVVRDTRVFLSEGEEEVWKQRY